MLLVLLLAQGVSSLISTCSSSVVTYNESGCTDKGHYSAITTESAAECCSKCGDDDKCAAWTFHVSDGKAKNACYFNDVAGVTHDVSGATCGCKNEDCQPNPSTCKPVYRPPKSKRVPNPPNTPPHLLSIIIDDLGWDDTSLRGNPDITFTPNFDKLAKTEGIILDRHHTYLWCSPTRRSFLSGRYPVHITGTQAPTCSNFLPVQFTILSEKLAVADYESHFIGKGHLGYQTMDHLPVNRGFETHVGYLGGGESYRWGGRYGSPYNLSDVKHFDMWLDLEPARNLVPEIVYSTNFYTSQALDRIRNRNVSRPFWLHLTYQAVHGGNWRQDVPVQDAIPANKPVHIRDIGYGSATKAMDDGLGNITELLKAQGMWENTFIVITSDNGGDCGLVSQPGSASNYPLLGRKCTAFEGGTRVAAFLTGGLIPTSQRGTTNHQLMHISDWYPTFCALAGVISTDMWKDPTTNLTHDIDGVNVWPSVVGGDDVPVNRTYLPTTDRSLLWVDGKGHMWKLINGNQPQANRFYQNGTNYMDTNNPCLHNGSVLASDHITVPPSCVVCSNSTPCLYDVLADPLETTNVAQNQSDIVKHLTEKLATYLPYVPPLSTDNLACYNCSASAITKWSPYVSPCCIAKST